MTDGGQVYGGAGWYQQLLDAINSLVSAELSKQFATGHVTTPARPAPTREDALHAIWNNRPDLKDFYDRMWGKDKYEPYHAVQNWLQITNEQSVVAQGRDPMAYAMDRGWVKPASEETTAPTVEREAMEAQRALGYMNLMSQVKGPRDWTTYANLQRASAETGFPEWARALAQGLDLHPFQGGAVEGPQNLQSWLGLTESPQGPQGYVPGQEVQGYGGGYLGQGGGVPQAGYLQPHQVRAQQVASMSPSEQQMLAGYVESQGGWWDDWINKLQAASPTGQARGTSFFTGW